jgi:anti-sigma B factor antagonist
VKIQEEERGAHVVIRIIGTLALGENTRALQEKFEKVATEKSGALILDMSGLEHLDSTAVGVLVGGLKRLEGQSRRFYLVNPRERVASVFRITHLDSVFRTFGSVEEAVRSADLATEEETSEH